MPIKDTNDEDATTLGLRALIWTLENQSRAERLLALTGLAADDLRARAGDAEILAAVLHFLEAHEPDLVACAEAVGQPPLALVRAREELEA